MFLVFYLLNFILGCIFFIYQLKNEIHFSQALNILILTLGFNFLLRVFFTLVNFFVWLQNPLSRILAKDIDYFIYYSASRFWFDFLANLLLGLFFIGCLLLLNTLFKNKLLYPEEFLILPSSFVIAGWPLSFFLPVVLFLIVIFIFFGKILMKKEISERISTKKYHFIAALILNLLNIIFLPKLNFWRFG